MHATVQVIAEAFHVHPIPTITRRSRSCPVLPRSEHKVNCTDRSVHTIVQQEERRKASNYYRISLHSTEIKWGGLFAVAFYFLRYYCSFQKYQRALNQMLSRMIKHHLQMPAPLRRSINIDDEWALPSTTRCESCIPSSVESPPNKNVKAWKMLFSSKLRD